jgi:hypothetical protein
MPKKPTRAELEKKHGTPAEFAKAVWAAHADMTITVHEALCAIADYERKWTAAQP